MLFLVNVAQNEKGFLARRRAKKGKLPPTITGLSVGKYMASVLTLHGRASGLQKPFLAPYLNRGDVLIAGENVPGKLLNNRPYLANYGRRVCVNTLLSFLQKDPEGFRRQVLLIDPLGACMGVAVELLRVCSMVLLYTPKPEDYAPCRVYLQSTMGADLIVTSPPFPKVDCVLAPYGTGNCMVPAGVPIVGEGHRLFPEFENLPVPEFVRQAVPDGFDPVAVTAGLFAAFCPEVLMQACLK